jgi:hypothetical protein
MMKTKPFAVILATLVLSFLFVANALAMSSTHYRLDWFTPMSGSGGPASSTSYAANFTVGQTVVGASTRTNYGIGLGYWYGVGTQQAVFLPLVLKSP